VDGALRLMKAGGLLDLQKARMARRKEFVHFFLFEIGSESIQGACNAKSRNF
jgi:hypothetical protein